MQRVLGVTLGKDPDTKDEARGAEDPAYRVLGTARGDQSADRREREEQHTEQDNQARLGTDLAGASQEAE